MIQQLPRWLLLPSVLLLLMGCGQGEPGTPWNHPLLWSVGLAFAFLCIGGDLWLLEGALRRHGRREDRRDRRDERGPS
jgi:hypothetical protein